MNHSINGDNISEDANSLEVTKVKLQEYKDSFKKESISSLDIILPPFIDLNDRERPNFDRMRLIESNMINDNQSEA